MLSKRNDTVVYIKRMGYGISDWMIDSKIPVILVFGEYFDWRKNGYKNFSK